MGPPAGPISYTTLTKEGGMGGTTCWAYLLHNSHCGGEDQARPGMISSPVLQWHLRLSGGCGSCRKATSPSAERPHHHLYRKATSPPAERPHHHLYRKATWLPVQKGHITTSTEWPHHHLYRKATSLPVQKGHITTCTERAT